MRIHLLIVLLTVSISFGLLPLACGGNDKSSEEEIISEHKTDGTEMIAEEEEAKLEGEDCDSPSRNENACEGRDRDD